MRLHALGQDVAKCLTQMEPFEAPVLDTLTSLPCFAGAQHESMWIGWPILRLSGCRLRLWQILACPNAGFL